MARETNLTDPVQKDQLPHVDDAIAVGEDLAFQEKWWKFEHVVWILFLLILVADVLGVFGRGWLAKAERKEPGSAMDVKYERVERNGTASTMYVQFGPDAVQNGTVHLFMSESLAKQLGMQRMVPQPSESVIGDGGITYTLPVQGAPAKVQMQLQPSSPGIDQWTLQVPGKTAVGGRVVVVP